MLFSSLLSLALVPSTLAIVIPTTGNPFLGRQLYANSKYAAKLEATISSFYQQGDSINAARTKRVQRTGTFAWISSNADVPSISTYIDEALTIQKNSQRAQIVEFVVYNLPDRDCSAKASDGELKIADDGLNKYKLFIDDVAAAISVAKADELSFVVILEPDSLANLVTNLAVEKCAGAEQAYKAGVAYAIKKLQFSNVHLYLDAAHGGWLGWDGNLEPSAKLFAEVLGMANSNSTTEAKVRGLATNVSNYNAYIAVPRENFTEWSNSWDESHYVNSLAPYLEAEGFPAHFIIDQGRAGKLGIRQEWGQWCNVKGAGFGALPTTETNDTLVDALVWVKPGGESDGTSNSTSPRFDEMCVSAVADVPAPEAGAWFNEFTRTLVKNANPPLEPMWI
ncbi:uncharacterized protein LAJ45_06474 [Morchella importuna]|uniref:Glucanase n=1 Tax=Morchella conica CCBAS932 TaxID=1392247 RepID=A0A3N4L6R9_9PEZI|nr:uncharacterized protein LAJ45_06474 [Morchella importuna]KAH8149395.1 hypothetical protein LAJ45_06474 [Morchella importuna]RPB17179.1 cellobiohydrolase [Morchella conica CCBAS932]